MEIHFGKQWRQLEKCIIQCQETAQGSKPDPHPAQTDASALSPAGNRGRREPAAHLYRLQLSFMVQKALGTFISKITVEHHPVSIYNTKKCPTRPQPATGKRAPGEGTETRTGVGTATTEDKPIYPKLPQPAAAAAKPPASSHALKLLCMDSEMPWALQQTGQQLYRAGSTRDSVPSQAESTACM